MNSVTDTERFSLTPPAGLVDIAVGADDASCERRVALARRLCTVTGIARSQALATLDRIAADATSRGERTVGVFPIGGTVAAFVGRAAELSPAGSGVTSGDGCAGAIATVIARSEPKCAVQVVHLPFGHAVRRIDVGTIAVDDATGVELARVQYLLPSTSGRRLAVLSFSLAGNGDRQELLAVAEQTARCARWWGSRVGA